MPSEISKSDFENNNGDICDNDAKPTTVTTAINMFKHLTLKKLRTNKPTKKRTKKLQQTAGRVR